MDELIEKLAELEHEQWVEWSKELVRSEMRLSFARIERWKKLWVPYSELTEEQKEQDRVYARKVIEVSKAKVGILRQLLNEDHIDDPKKMIDNEYIETVLGLKNYGSKNT